MISEIKDVRKEYADRLREIADSIEKSDCGWFIF